MDSGAGLLELVWRGHDLDLVHGGRLWPMRIVMFLLGSALGVAAVTTALALAGGHRSQPGDVYPYHGAFAIAALVTMAITASRRS